MKKNPKAKSIQAGRILGHGEKLKELMALADSGNLKHAYMFFGPWGVGKKTLALSLAKHLEHGDPYSERILGDCILISPGTNSSIGIEESRKVKAFLSERPNVSKYRIAIIDRAETMTNEAQNALLKITEEPPQSSLIILIGTDPETLWPTLESRLAKIFFPPVRESEIEEWLIEDRKISGSKAKSLAEMSFGKPALAVMFFEDKKFSSLLQEADGFLSATPIGLKNVLTRIKTKLDREDFNFKELLDTIILRLAEKKGKNPILWHKVMELRKQVEDFALNPRIQLQNIHRLIK